MELNDELENKRIKRAIKALNHELLRDTGEYNRNICIASSALMAGFACSAVASLYTEVATAFSLTFMLGSIVTLCDYKPNFIKHTKKYSYSIFKSYGAISADADKDAINCVLNSYVESYNSLLKNKKNLSKEEFASKKNTLTNEYSKKIKSINNEERSEELFN